MATDKWLNSAGGDFATASNWSTGMVPGSTTDALLTTAGTYTVTSGQNETVNSIQIAQHVTLAITGSTFYAENGTGSGLNSGVIAINNNNAFEAGGTIAGAGTIQLNSGGNGTDFILNANVALSGGGALVLDDNSNNYVVANSVSYVLSNVSDTISGAGQFGNGAMSFSNGAAGVVNANAASNALVMNFGAGVATNAGLMEATGTGGLVIRGSTITQSGTGTIKAIGAGIAVSLDNGTIVGGTLATSGGGVIQSVSAAELSGVTIAAASTVSLLNNTSLALDGTITNKGSITLNSGGNGTELIVNTATVTLTGAGKLILSDNSQNYIYSSVTTPNLLINVNNTISGGGQFGNAQLSLDNQALGIINANATNALNINTGPGTFKNEGLLEATNTGGLGLNGVTVTNAGTILATGVGVAVNLAGATIVGGTLKDTSGGIIQSVNSGTLDGSPKAVTITTGSMVAALNNTLLALDGSIVNNGTIALDSAGNGTELLIDSPIVTLSGGGQVLLTDNSQNYIYSSNATAPFDKLVNVDNTISGAGQFGSAQLSVDNKIGGTINATGVNALNINTAGGSFSNEGIIEDTGAGGLGLYGATTIVNTGTIAAIGAGSHVDLNNGTVQGGTLKTTAGGIIQSVNVGTLDGLTSGAVTITTGSQIADLNNQYLYFDGSIVNQGTISLDSAGNGTFFWVNSPTVTLTGAGTIAMTDNTQNYIDATVAGYELVNVNNTIVGSGQIGRGTTIAVDNQAAGIINSNGGAGLALNNADTASFTNEGLIEDTGTGGIGLNGGTTIVNTGTIAAFGAGSHIDLRNGSSIEGGTLATSGGGVIQSVDQGTLDGATNGAITITAGSQIADQNAEYLFLDGSIFNQGTIALNSVGNGTFLWINTATVRLTGAGTILMSDNGQNYIDATVAGNKLVNVNNTIIGSGQIGRGTAIAVDNQAAGIINANGGAGLALNNAGAASFTNEGLIEDTGPGGIGLNGGTTIINTGTIAAFGAGSHIDLRNGSAIAGGTLATTGGGIIQSVDQGTLDGASHGAITITAGSQIIDNNNEYLFLDGTVANHGTISLISVGNATDLFVNSAVVTLSGGGAVTLDDNSQNYVLASVGGDELVNFNDTLSGAGQIGNGGSLLIDNQAAATINAIGGNNLNINLGGAAFTNEGTAEGTGSGGLLIQNTTLTNTGTIASLSGSNVNIASSTTLTNYNSGTLTGGTYKAISAGGTNTSTLTIAAGPITTDNAHLVVSGVGASIVAGGTSVVTSIATIGATGELDIQNGATFTAFAPLAVSGTILLSGSLSDSSITTTSKGLISANGGAATLSTTGRLLNNGTLQATSGGTLTITGGSLNSAGTVVAQAGGTVMTSSTERVANFAAGTLTGGTWAAIGSGATLLIGAGIVTTDAATLTLSGPGSSIRSGSSARQLDASLTTVATTGVLNVLNSRGFSSGAATGLIDNGIISLGGAKFIASGVTIATGATFQGGGTLASAVVDNGVLASSAAPLGSNGTLTVTGAISGTGLLNATTATTLNTTGGYAVGSITVAAGGVFTGAGSASGAVTVAGTLAVGATGTLSVGRLSVTGLVSAPSIIASGVISDSGIISLAGGTLSGGSISIATATAALTGYGTVVQNVANTGTIEAAGGTLTLAAGETGGTVHADAGATLATQALSAANLVIDAGGNFIGAGTSTSVADAGTLTASGGVLTLNANSGAGTAVIAAGATLDSTGTLTISSLTFGAGSSQTLELATPSGNTSLISNWASGDTIDLLNTTVTAFTYGPGVGLLTLKDAGVAVGTLSFTGSYTRANFSLSGDGHGGTDVVFVASAPAAVDPLTDLQAAVAASAGGAPAPAPASLAAAPTAPSLGASFHMGAQSEPLFDAHFAAQ